MRAYLQANVGTTAVVDEEIEVCTAQKQNAKLIKIKKKISARGGNLPFIFREAKTIIRALRDDHSRVA